MHRTEDECSACSKNQIHVCLNKDVGIPQTSCLNFWPLCFQVSCTPVFLITFTGWVSGCLACLSVLLLKVYAGEKGQCIHLWITAAERKRKKSRDFLALLDLHMSLGNRHPCASCSLVCWNQLALPVNRQLA